MTRNFTIISMATSTTADRARVSTIKKSLPRANIPLSGGLGGLFMAFFSAGSAVRASPGRLSVKNSEKGPFCESDLNDKLCLNINVGHTIDLRHSAL